MSRNNSVYGHKILGLGALCASIASAVSNNPLQPSVLLPSNATVLGRFSLDITNPSSTFQGIPFAEPPVGALRFQPPVGPYELPSGEKFQALTPSSVCPQVKIGTNAHLGKEDCLYLDVYTPNRSPGDRSSEKLPVMFWMFGGGYVAGDGWEFDLYAGQNLAVNTNSIVVTSNYRVGPFGFLATDITNGGSRGNMGIQDQRLALKWVHENIEAFGGDSDRVMIFGQSAGAMSVCNHYANAAASSGLFSAAVMQSGNCNTPEFFFELEDAMEFGREFSKAVGCDPDTGDEQYRNCMLSLSTSDLMYGFDPKSSDSISTIDPSLHEFVPPLSPIMPFGPVIDGTIEGTPLLPYDAIKSGKSVDAPLLIGSTSNEGSLFIPAIPWIVDGVNFPLSDDDVKVTVHHILDPILGADKVDELYPSLMDLYDIKDFNNSNREQLSKILRDYMFACPSRRAARAVVENGQSAFLYQFDFLPKLWPDFEVMGDYHGAELYFIWDTCGPGMELVHVFFEAEKKIVKFMEDWWGNFAREGKPGNGWEEFSYKGDQYMHISSEPELSSGLLKKFCDFHDEFLGYVDVFS